MNWQYQESHLYEHAWQNEYGEHLWIEDATQILSPTKERHVTDLKNERYRVLEQEPYASDAELKELFDDVEDAVDYVEENYSVSI